MGRSTDYEVSIEVSGELSDAELAELKERITAQTEVGAATVWNTGGGGYFSGDGTTYGDYEEWAREQSKLLFRILGRCEISWSWYFTEREPDDYTCFYPDDYDEMVAPLEQLAKEAE